METKYAIYFASLVLLISGTRGDSTDKPDFINTRIAGGHDANIWDVPYQVEITYKGEHLCSGALVRGPHGNQVILTTAECVVNDVGDKNPMDVRDLTHMHVRAGVVSRSGNVDRASVLNRDAKNDAQEREIRRMVKHEYFVRPCKRDIAVILLHRGFELNDNVQTIPLPPSKDLHPETNATLVVSGWGPTSKENEAAEHLQVINLSAFPLSECVQAYYPQHANNLIDIEGNMCGYDYNSKGIDGPCLGDEGAPAVVKHYQTGERYLAGIYSWSEPGCHKQRNPPIFTKLSAYLTWIKDNSSPYLLPPSP